MSKLIGIFLTLCISVLGLRGSVNYVPVESNPLFETWRWKSFAELGDKGIRCFVEGQDQSLWFGTAKGVFHYDGLNWVNYLQENEILQAPVYALCYTGNGTLYAVSLKGICHFTKGTWTTDMTFPKQGVLGSEWEILNMTETDNGDIWVGLHFGLVQLSNKKVNIYSTPAQMSGLRDAFPNADIYDVSGIYSGVESFIVYDIMKGHDGNLWLGLEDGRTIRFFSKTSNLKIPGRYVVYSESDGMSLARLPILFESSTGEIYNIAQSNGGGVNKFDPGTQTWSFHLLSDDFVGDNIKFSICETPDGTLWIGGFNRIFAYKNGAWNEYKQPQVQVPPTRIILEPTSDGSLWIIGHQADVMRIEYITELWTTYKDLLYQCQTSDGKQWFINGKGKVISYDSVSSSWEMLDDEFPLSDPTRIFIDRSGTMWAVGSNQGVAALAWNISGSWILRTFPEICWGFHSNGVFQSRDNSVWFGANADCGSSSWGIVRYSPKTGTPYDDNAWKVFSGSEICEVAYALSETDNNSLLCGNFKGLFEYDGSKVRELHQVLFGDVIKVESMIQDPVKGVWIGTRSQGVIYYINDNNWKQYTVENGLASNSISSLIFTEDSTLWAATDKGISRFDGEKWNRLALPDYFKIIRGNGTLEKGVDNSLWINTCSIEWYRRVLFNKEFDSENSPLVSYKIQPEKISPETKIVKFDPKVYYPGNTMIIWQGTDRWNDTKPSDLQYSYKIDDGPWSDFSSETSHTFLSLSRGWHTISVRSRDNFLNIDTEPSVIKVKAIPPIWGQIWFLMLMAALIAAIIYFYTISLKKNREMEAQNLLMKQKNDNLVKQQTEIEEKGRQIMELLEKERESHWYNEGVIAISDVIKANKDDIDSLAHSLTVKLIEYIGAYSAGIMILKNDEGETQKSYLELLSAYGFNKERLQNKKIGIDEGLVGACFKDKKTMIFKNVPQNYFVGSGLGKSQIAELVLVPLKLHDDIVGIIEMSSFKSFDEKKIKLLEIISENVASNLISLEAKAQIEKLYKQSQENTARLHEQEEELFQQMEELNATQEESRRREEQLSAELEQFKKKNSRHKKE